LSRSTCASASVASALAFSAGIRAVTRLVADCFAAVAASRGALTAGDSYLELFDVTLRHNAGVTSLQVTLDVEFVLGLFECAIRILKLAFRLEDVGLRREHGSVDLGDLALGRFQRRLRRREVH
jgi:hypothetical protein